MGAALDLRRGHRARRRGGCRRRQAHAGHAVEHAVGDDRRRDRAEGREPAADRQLQDPRGDEQARVARADAAPGSHRRQSPGTTPRRSRSRRATPACRARSSCPPVRRWRRWRRVVTTARPWSRSATRSTRPWLARRSGPPRTGWRSATRSTTWRSSPARPRSASSCSTTCPNLRRVLIPLGGGGLAAGAAIALKAKDPSIHVVGVQVEACAPYANQPAAGGAVVTLADGIAVKKPGRDHAAADRPVGRRHRGRRRGGGRRRDGRADGAGEAVRRGRRRGRRGGADVRAGVAVAHRASPASC